MRTFVIHTEKDEVVAIATTDAADAPPLIGSGDEAHLVTPIDLPDGALPLSGPDSEAKAPDALRALDVEGLIARARLTGTP